MRTANTEGRAKNLKKAARKRMRRHMTEAISFPINQHTVCRMIAWLVQMLCRMGGIYSAVKTPVEPCISVRYTNTPKRISASRTASPKQLRFFLHRNASSSSRTIGTYIQYIISQIPCMFHLSSMEFTVSSHLFDDIYSFFSKG